MRRSASLLAVLALAGCDDETAPAPSGGGPGFMDASNLASNANGFCNPQGGEGALGSSAYSSSGTAKIDTDGNPNGGKDATWSPNTSGKVNGQNVDSSKYAYVVMSKEQMLNSGVGLGDWAKVSNNATSQSAFARVEDVGPSGGEGEISQAAARSVGIQYDSRSFTVGNPQITVLAYANTSAIQSDCP